MTNPLLDLGFNLPFDKVLPEHIVPAVDALLARTELALKAIEDVKEPRTYVNTLGAYDASAEALGRAMRLVGHLESVATTPELRKAYNVVNPKVSEFLAGIELRPGLWQAMREYSATEDATKLTGTRARFLKKTLDSFRKSGANLDEAGKQRQRDISREMAELTSKFGQNVLDDTMEFELVVTDETKLTGLPPWAIDAARASAEAKGVAGYRFTLQAPSLTPVLSYLDAREIREKVWRAYNTRASQGERNNAPIIARILQLRNEQAQLLGNRDFACMVLEDRMAGTPERAIEFVENLHSKSASAFAQETSDLQAFRVKLEGPQAPPLEAWDVGYYAEKERKALYDFDEEELRPYFVLDRVVEGMFETARRLYQVNIQPNTQLKAWHKDVRAFDILGENGEHLASFYADFFPREEKQGGAWMNCFVSGTVENGNLSPHLGLIVTNATPPVGDKPALLSHSDVTTLFHEFGHLLHQCLSRVEVRSLAGTNVAWDFVELPSQIMENWSWERESLDVFARHYQTNETIPEPLFERMQRARMYRAASVMMRQLGFAALDLALHVRYRPERDGDVLTYARAKMQPYATAELPENYAMLASFSHLFSSPVGYAAGYYSYKWAEVLDADAFTRFKQGGVFNPEVGNAFRRTVLERGDSEDPMELYRAFMGREPDLDALLERFGLKAA
jgi:oligopeptidase A